METDLKNQIIEVIKTIFDPEIPVNIYELGLIYEINLDETGLCDIKMTLTSPNCPAAQSLPAEVETKVKGVPGVSNVKLEIVWEPTWGPDKMTEAARLQLGMF